LLLYLIRANPLVGDGVSDRIEKEFASGQNIYILEALKFLEGVLSLSGEAARRVFLVNIGAVAEELRLDFSDRKQWEDILSKL
jgi:hypothetical protein